MDPVRDALEHVDYLYSLGSANRELYKVSLMLRGAISLLFVVDLDIRYLD
jgi:hypothetical protein